jgi:hypothetical protein
MVFPGDLPGAVVVFSPVLQLVGMMDRINRYRFRNQPHMLVAWETAKHVVTGPQPKAETPASPTQPGQPGTTGQAGEVKPAA